MTGTRGTDECTGSKSGSTAGSRRPREACRACCWNETCSLVSLFGDCCLVRTWLGLHWERAGREELWTFPTPTEIAAYIPRFNNHPSVLGILHNDPTHSNGEDGPAASKLGMESGRLGMRVAWQVCIYPGCGSTLYRSRPFATARMHHRSNGDLLSHGLQVLLLRQRRRSKTNI